jgi:pimeloyl-ACP methyl ester carboxylesterase
MAEEFRSGDHILVHESVGSGALQFLLVHGIGLGKAAYREFIEAMDEKETCIAPDIPGFGESPQPDRSLSIRQMAELVARCIDDQQIAPRVSVRHFMGSRLRPSSRCNAPICSLTSC